MEEFILLIALVTCVVLLFGSRPRSAEPQIVIIRQESVPRPAGSGCLTLLFILATVMFVVALLLQA